MRDMCFVCCFICLKKSEQAKYRGRRKREESGNCVPEALGKIQDMLYWLFRCVFLCLSWLMCVLGKKTRYCQIVDYTTHNPPCAACSWSAGPRKSRYPNTLSPLRLRSHAHVFEWMCALNIKLYTMDMIGMNGHMQCMLHAYTVYNCMCTYHQVPYRFRERERLRIWICISVCTCICICMFVFPSFHAWFTMNTEMCRCVM